MTAYNSLRGLMQSAAICAALYAGYNGTAHALEAPVKIVEAGGLEKKAESAEGVLVASGCGSLYESDAGIDLHIWDRSASRVKGDLDNYRITLKDADGKQTTYRLPTKTGKDYEAMKEFTRKTKHGDHMKVTLSADPERAKKGYITSVELVEDKE